MLKRIQLENFKSWRQLDLKFGQITGLFGTNSSGKSSLIQFLLLLKQTKDASDRNVALDLNGSLVELGTIQDVIFNHETDLDLNFRLEFSTEKQVSLRDTASTRNRPFLTGSRIALEASLSIEAKEAISKRLSYTFEDARFDINLQDKPSRYRLDTNLDENEFRFVRTQGRAWHLPSPTKTYQFPDQARLYYQNASFLADLELQFEEQADKIFYLGPLREYPQRDYLWARTRPTDAGKKGERAVDAILAATAQGEKRNLKPKAHLKPFQEMIAYWLKELGLIDNFRVHEIADGSNRYQVKVQTVAGGAEVLLTDVGFGVSQILPVITLLYYVPSGSTVVLEQPEIHLHPLAQAELADVIINVANRRNIQVIIESHSEHLLLRLQRRIAEEEMKADDVELYFFDKMNEASNSTKLELDMFGNIQNWPKNFMGNAFGETAEAELARISRRAKNG